MNLKDYLDIRVSPKSKLIPLSEKYSDSVFIFEYKDGESSMVDCYGDTLPKGKRTLRQNLSGAETPSDDETVDFFAGNLINKEDLIKIQAKNKNIKRVWVLE